MPGLEDFDFGNNRPAILKVFDNGAFLFYAGKLNSDEDMKIYLYIPKTNKSIAKVVLTNDIISRLKLPNINSEDYFMFPVSNDGKSFVLINYGLMSEQHPLTKDSILDVIVTNHDLPIWEI